jgi:amino acid adenylation domain-containing protein
MFSNTILLPFLNQLELNPKNNAFCIDEEFYTYGDLKNEILKIIHCIENQNYSSSKIGLVVNDDITTYASIWAIWMKGLTYIPLHPKHPADRNNEIIQQAGINLVLNSNETVFKEEIPAIYTATWLGKVDNIEIISASEESNAYVLFTSGSTGVPKGVPISRKNIASFIKSFLEVGFSIDQNDRFLQCFDLTFDVSVQSYVVPLIHGACVYTIPHHAIKFSYVYGLLDDHQLTFAAMAPSMIRFLRPYFDELDLPSLKYNILTAEASPLDLVDEWAERIPNATIYNFYGPTEATIYCTYYQYNRNNENFHANGNISIGKPMNGVDTLILDADLHPIQNENVKGELYVSGNQLTKGYLNNEEKNKESFTEIEFNNEKRIFYKTGDVCYYQSLNIMYVGRADYQVKIQGYRVELSEIEYHAREALSGKNAVALTYLTQTNNNEIALFVEGDELNENHLKGELKKMMPHYMVPARYILKDIFPINTNGKVNRIELKTILEESL